MSQALTEARAMLADIQSAQTLADLDALYVNWIGYSIVVDGSSATFEEVRDILDDYIVEFCYGSDIDPSEVFPDFDETLR